MMCNVKKFIGSCIADLCTYQLLAPERTLFHCLASRICCGMHPGFMDHQSTTAMHLSLELYDHSTPATQQILARQGEDTVDLVAFNAPPGNGPRATPPARLVKTALARSSRSPPELYCGRGGLLLVGPKFAQINSALGLN